MVVATRVTVGTSPVLLSVGTAGVKEQASGAEWPEATPDKVAVKNIGANTVYVGGEDVAAVDGFPLEPQESLGLDLVPGEELYGIRASGSSAVAVLKAGAS